MHIFSKHTGCALNGTCKLIRMNMVMLFSLVTLLTMHGLQFCMGCNFDHFKSFKNKVIGFCSC